MATGKLSLGALHEGQAGHTRKAGEKVLWIQIGWENAAGAAARLMETFMGGATMLPVCTVSVSAAGGG